MAASHPITAAMVREFLNYCPDTGVFTWRIHRCGRAKAGATAGSVKAGGYRQIKVCGKRLMEHRLAFLLMTGEWPMHDVDHINGNPADNRWLNLRDLPTAMNMQNQRRAFRTKNGRLLGAYWHKRVGKWQAAIMTDGKLQHLGYFSDEASAHHAYVEAKRKVHPAGML